MRETALTFSSAGLTLAATFTRPSSQGPTPGVLLIGGSGPLDRDGNHRRLHLDISRQLAAALAEAGIASLRYDKRGVGASEGSFLAAGLDDNVADAGAALAALRSCPGVDPGRMFVLGHSEGAIIAVAMLAAGARATGAVLLSPTARSGAEVLRWQTEQLVKDIPAPVRVVLRLLRIDVAAKVARNHAKLRASTGDVIRLGGRRINARWFREFMAYDPAKDLSRLTVPVLAIAGGKDLQAPPQDLATIRALLGDRARTILLDDLSHLLRSQPGAPTLRHARRDVTRPVDPRLLAAVVDWLRER